MKQLLINISASLLLLFPLSCSDDDLSYFQKNDPEPEYSLFDILDDYPALKSAFDPIDQRIFNNLLSNALNDTLGEAKDVLDLTDDLLADPGHPVTSSITHLRNTLHRVITQDEIDFDSDKSRTPPEYFSNGLYELWDLISEKDISISENIISILRKVISYIKDTYRNEEIEEIMTELIAFIRSNEAYLWRDNENNLIEDLARLFFQADENIWLDENGNFITDRGKLSAEGATDTGVGNASRGMDALLIGMNAIMNDDTLREDIIKILREVGNLFAVSVQGKKLKDIIKDFTHNVQKYLTPGGEEYEKWEGYEWPKFNPYSGYGTYNGERTDNSERIFADASLRNTLNEVLPGMISMMLRADRDGAGIYDRDGEKTYFLEVIAKNHWKTNVTPDNPRVTYSCLEEAFYDHIRLDEYGRDRLVDSYDIDYFDTRVEPSPMCNLEAMFALFFGTAVTMGWQTADGNKEGLNTGELVDNPSAYYGNITTNGIISMAMIFNGMGFNYLLGINPFDIAFSEKTKDHLFRSAFYFDADEKDDNKFYIDKEFSFLGFLSGPLVGSSGFPESDGGGRNPYDENGEPILNGYKAYSAGGNGNSDIASWLLGVVVQYLMLGQGPYYTTEDGKQEGNVYTYYSPNGTIYANIIKPDPDDASTWDYIYIADKNDAIIPALFFADVDLIADGGVYLTKNAAIKINIDGITRDISFESGRYWHQDDVVENINNAFNGDFTKNPAAPAGKGFQIAGANKTPPEGIVEISNVSGNGIAELIRMDYNGRRPLREYAGRELRYRELMNSDYFMVEYTPFGSLDGPILVSPADMSGNATGPGSLLGKELIPEHCVERECKTFEEAIGRNFEWFFAEALLSLPITLYFSIPPDVIKDVIETILMQGSNIPWYLEWVVDRIIALLPDEIMGLPVTIAIEGHGGTALFNLKYPHASADNPMMDRETGAGRWVKDGGYDRSLICGDFRFSLILPDKLMSDEIMGLLNLLGLEEIIDQVIDAVLYGGNIMGLLEIDPILSHNMPLAPTLMSNVLSISHIVFPKQFKQQVYSKEGNNAMYNDDYDLIFGSRQGELMKDENGIYHSEYGLEHSDNDINWINRNGVGLIFILLLEGLYEFSHYDMSQYDPKIVGSTSTHNGLKLMLNDLLGPFAMPPLFYYEKDTPDNRYPHNSWKPHLVGGKLLPNHPLGERYYDIDEDGDPFSTYFLTPTDFIASSGVNKDTGEPLTPNSDVIFGGWALRNYYRPADIRNIFNMLIDSDPFSKNPKRCDGILPLITAYDITKYNTMDKHKEANTRLISNIFRFIYDLGNPKYDDPNGPGNIDENDMSTWGIRRKLCYGLEQFITTLRVPKGYQAKMNETNYKRLLHNDWIFSEDEKGNPFPIRPEDVKFEVAEYPAPPEVEDWTNFVRMMDALGELLSDRGESGGKYNIIEDVVSIIEKIFKKVNFSEKNARGLRHTIGAALTSYNKADSGWDYPDDLLHILEKELPGILEVFKGHYGNLLTLAEGMVKKNGNDENFLAYIAKNLKSAYSTKDVAEQLYEFLGIDLIKYHDSALWSDMTELIISFVDMINVEETPGWLEDNTFVSNKEIEDIDPYEAMGELLSW